MYIYIYTYIYIYIYTHLSLSLSLYIYIYIYVTDITYILRNNRNRPAPPIIAVDEAQGVTRMALGKGQMGSALMGSMRCSCFFDRGSFWVLP